MFRSLRCHDQSQLRPNAWWFFEGRQLRVRASKDIAAWEEIAFTYGQVLISDFAARKHVHDLSYNFNCNCELCKKEPLGPTAALRARILKILQPSKEGFSFIDHFRDAQRAIWDMTRAGFGLGDWPMRDLHEVVLSNQLLLGKNAEALKTILTILYIITDAG